MPSAPPVLAVDTEAPPRSVGLSGEITWIPQYGLAMIVLIWAAAAVPMAALAWIMTPFLADRIGGPIALTQALIIALTAGLVWQFVLVLALVQREQGTLRWRVVRESLWLRAPRDPGSGRSGGWSWLLLLPLIIAFVAVPAFVPVLPHAADRDMGIFLGSPAGRLMLSGAFGWFAVIGLLLVFNTVLGEELLFRGFLLPRMSRVFGRWDWFANGVLFTAYHLHAPWAMPFTLFDSMILAYPSRRYRSALIGIIVHSSQSVLAGALLVKLVLS